MGGVVPLGALCALLLPGHAAGSLAAPLSPLPGVRAQGMEQLTRWVRANGGFVSERLEVGCLPGRGVSVCARGEIPAGEELLRIPGSLDLARSVDPRENILLAALSQPQHWDTQVSVHMAMQLDRLSARLLGGSQEFYAPFWEALDLDACCAGMPYFRGSEEWELLRGSAEFHRRSEYARLLELCAGLGELAREDPGLELGALNETRVIMANHFLSTHAFTDAEGGRRLMPLAINLNHDVQARAGAAWRWDAETDSLSIVASKVVAAGEEVTISYGLKSNAQLMSTYGFTLEPAAEPVFSFRAASVADLLPPGSDARDLSFRVKLVTLPAGAGEAATASALRRMGPLRELLRRAAAWGPDGVLSDLVEAGRARLEEDAAVRDFVAQLRENRRRPGRQGSAVWWCSEGGDCPRDGSGPEALGSQWRSDVVRMKMSEYLCLLSYAEALDLRSGALAAEEALRSAVDLVPLLDALLRV